MKSSLFRWGTALLAAAAIAGCGGGGGTAVVTPPTTGTAVNTAITTAAAVAVNDTSTTPNVAFTVLQAAGVPAVTVNSPPVVNFTVFSDGRVVTGLNNTNVRFALAKMVPGADGNPDEWVSYIKKTVTGVTVAGVPAVKASAVQATTDTATAAQLVYNPDGYYTYTFNTDIKAVSGVAYEPNRTHRVAIQLSYKNAAGATVLANPYFDFTIVDGKSVPVTDVSKTRKMADVTSCNSCHEKLALHGGGRIDTQYCVMCHNPGTVDPESGNALTMSTMVHKIHAGKRLAADGDGYTITGYGNTKYNYAEVGFPQDLRNCSKCHTAANTATPQGDNWKKVVSKEACLSCHTAKAGQSWDVSHVVYAKDAAVVGSAAAATNTAATDLTNKQCAACHVGNISSETVHWNQNEENAVKYKMNIESVTVKTMPTLAAAGAVTVNYFLSDPTNGNAAYNLKADTAKFGKLNLMLAYAKMKGQSIAVTDFSNGGSEKIAATSGTDLGGNHYTAEITVAKLTDITDFAGTGRVVSYGQILEPLQTVKSVDHVVEAPIVTRVNTLAQNTYMDFAITGTMQSRRLVVSNDKCNACHGALGATSGANELVNAFHSGARNTIESCAVCHDANKVSSTVMANGFTNATVAVNESYQFKRMIHGIHGNSKRTYPFTHGNVVQGVFSKAGVLTSDGKFATDQKVSIALTSGATAVSTVVIPAGTVVPAGKTFQTIADLISEAAVSKGYNPVFLTPAKLAGTAAASAAENYAAEVAYPGIGLNCNACHVNDSYKQDLSPLGSVVQKLSATDPLQWNVISPKAASCTACHDSSAAVGHVTSFGGSVFASKTQAAIAALPRETCEDCHASGGFKGVDIVHGQK